jgi:hypothetical protein
MPAELRHPALQRRNSAHTYFVGRRESGVAELYAVTAGDVERLRADRLHGRPGLDWRGDDTAALELGRLLLKRVVEPPLSSALTTEFARSALATLPTQGFVLDSDVIWGWAIWASRAEKPSSRKSGPQRSWFARLLANLFGAWHA